ncbi:CC_3452 family protein [Phenylobacterium sp.]|uniref:CC_3452 family protein n=1 Tax=Phenylobacterium sp. TaxID=1871053 RepID=UPI003D28780A
MQNFRCVSAIAAMAVFAAGGAFAQTTGYRGEARLATPSTAPVAQTIGGVAWRCDGDACQGEAARKGNVDGVVRECKKVVAVIGPVASYRSGARELTDSQVRACNKAAIQLQTARN